MLSLLVTRATRRAAILLYAAPVAKEVVLRPFSDGEKPGQRSAGNSAAGTATAPPTAADTDAEDGEDATRHLVVETDEELQPQWRALESRVNNRASRPRKEGVPTGRGPRRGSAWDHENV